MINHSRRYPSQTISTRVLAAAVAHSLARLCRLPRVRKANGNDFCRAGRPEAWRVIPSDGSNPSSAFPKNRGSLAVLICAKTAPSFQAGIGTANNIYLGWRLTVAGVIFYFSSPLFCH
jgi:hypothetical protein